MNQLYQALVCSGLTVVGSILTYFPSLSHSTDLPNYQLRSLPSLPQHKSATFWLERGAARAVKGDYQGAIADYNQSLHLNLNADTYYNRGVAYYYQGQQQQAWLDFNQALKLKPEMAEAYGNRGELRSQMGDRLGAVQDFQQAAKLFEKQGELTSAFQMQAESKNLQR